MRQPLLVLGEAADYGMRRGFEEYHKSLKSGFCYAEEARKYLKHPKADWTGQESSLFCGVSQIPKKSDFYDTNGVLKYRECLEYSRFMIRTREKIS